MPTILDLALSLQNGTISLADWQVGMMDTISDLHAAAAAQSAGGWGNMTQADWGFEGSLVKKQYGYLRGFVADIESGKQPLNGTLKVRAGLYEQAARGTQEEMTRRFQSFRGFDEERRVLSPGDNCPGCIEQAALDWQPLGTLDPIGAEECKVNCRCEFEYRRSNADGTFTEE